MTTAAVRRMPARRSNAPNFGNWAATGGGVGMEWDEAYTLFIRSRRLGIYGASRAAREKTVEVYDGRVKRVFFGYMRDKRKYTHYNQMTEDDVLKFLEWGLARVEKKEISATTWHSYMRSIKAFFNWVDKDPACKQDGMKSFVSVLGKIPTDPGRQWLPTPEVMSAFLHSFNQQVRWGLRDHVVTSIMLDCGARVGEICHLRLSHLQLEGDTPQILIPEEGKTGMRAVPVDRDTTVPLVKRWLRERQRFAKDHDYVFVNKFGGRLTTGAMRQSFDDHRKRTGLGVSEHGNLTVHTVRHFFCTYYLVNGGSMHNLQRITGHKSMQTLMIYIHLANQIKSVAQEHARVSPLKNLAAAASTKKRRRVY